jgi:uncharacterized Zn finger protein
MINDFHKGKLKEEVLSSITKQKQLEKQEKEKQEKDRKDRERKEREEKEEEEKEKHRSKYVAKTKDNSKQRKKESVLAYKKRMQGARDSKDVEHKLLSRGYEQRDFEYIFIHGKVDLKKTRAAYEPKLHERIVPSSNFGFL